MLHGYNWTMSMLASHLLISPTLDCPADCSYCYSSSKKGVMQDDTLEAIIQWQKKIDHPYLHVTFHGGEPLLAGVSFFRMALSRFSQEFSDRRIQFLVQSNLWLLDDEFCELFSEYHCALGTSLDGPEDINDRQRGAGYYQKTMAGIDRARRYGLPVGCICTFTRQSARHVKEIVDFFSRNRLDFSIHPAVDVHRGEHNENGKAWYLDVDGYKDIMLELLDIYLTGEYEMKISTLDSLCQSVSTRSSELCTFSECLGNHIAVAPDGTIYPCQRFTGQVQFSMGNVLTSHPDDISSSETWRQFERRSRLVNDICQGCTHLDYCRGGCPYQAIQDMHGELSINKKDVYCEAYRAVFDKIVQQAMDELFSDENMGQIIRHPESESGLFRAGSLLSIIK